ncbi:UDP-N-acetylglucosamine 2-epimerase (non-hydrolyzing) [bacterium]|nr:UDP-N-acetylglucosamine 2-epimerase (non-hydrolyzing) [bacterium]
MLKVINIVGARPNFIKIAPIYRQMQQSGRFHPILIHTGQHYDEKMSQLFFKDLSMPKPDEYLGVGSGSHAEQTGKIMVALEKSIIIQKPDLILVVGDVNSTLAASILASKLSIPVAHVEAGLRSGDRSMPEEINRIITDSISDYLFVTEKSGLDHLKSEGISESKIHFTGNVMIDSLIDNLQKLNGVDILNHFSLQPKKYALVTLHRPSNVDQENSIKMIIDAFGKIQLEMPVIFPIHPRTRKMLDLFGLKSHVDAMPDLHLIDPVGYLVFLTLMKHAGIVLTDSGGIQEETTWLGIQCLTLRPNTERPSTVTLGTNRLVPLNTEGIITAFHDAIDHPKNGRIPPLWDGQTAQRIVDVLSDIYKKSN